MWSGVIQLLNIKNCYSVCVSFLIWLLLSCDWSLLPLRNSHFLIGPLLIDLKVLSDTSVLGGAGTSDPGQASLVTSLISHDRHLTDFLGSFKVSNIFDSFDSRDVTH